MLNIPLPPPLPPNSFAVCPPPFVSKQTRSWVYCLSDHRIIYIESCFFFFPVLNDSTTPDLEMPFGTAASLEWLTTCYVWWAAGPSSAAFGISLPCPERWGGGREGGGVSLFMLLSDGSCCIHFEERRDYFLNFTFTFLSNRRGRMQYTLPTV